MKQVFFVGLALLVSLLILSSVVPRPSGLGRQEASPGWPAWRIVNEPPLIIPDWRNHLPDPSATDDAKSIVERIKQAVVVVSGMFFDFRGSEVLALIDEPYRVIYNAPEFETESPSKDFSPGIMGPDGVSLLLDGITRIMNQISSREKTLQAATNTLDRNVKEILKSVGTDQGSSSRTEMGQSESAQEYVTEYINAVQALAAKISSDIAIELEKLAGIRSRCDLFYDNVCYRAGLVGWDDFIARPARQRRLPDSMVGNAIVLAVYAKEPWLRRCATDQLDFWQDLYPEARVTLQWIKDNEAEHAAEIASMIPEDVGPAENKTSDDSLQKPFEDARFDADNFYLKVFGYVPEPNDQNMARLTQCVDAITAVIGSVTPEELVAKGDQVLQSSVPGLTMLDALELLAQEAGTLLRRPTVEGGPTPPEGWIQHIATQVIWRTGPEKREVQKLAFWICDQLPRNQREPTTEVAANLVARIADTRRYFPQATAQEIAQQAVAIFRSQTAYDPNFTIWHAFDAMSNSANPQP